MPMTKAALLSGLLLGTILLVAAGGGDATGDTLVPARQAAFRLSGATFGGIKAALDRGDEMKTMMSPARSLAAWAHNLPAMFPSGSDGAGTKALPKVWSDRPGFTKAAATYAEAADKLAALIAAGDRPGAAAQWTVTRATCKSCHDTYHAPMPD